MKTKLLALLTLAFIARISVGSDGCTFSVYCRGIGTGGTNYPTASITCTNGFNHDSNFDWVSGRTSQPITYCDGDVVHVSYNSTIACATNGFPVVTVQCFHFPSYLTDVNVNSVTGFYTFDITLHTQCNTNNTCSPSGAAAGSAVCQGGGQ